MGVKVGDAWTKPCGEGRSSSLGMTREQTWTNGGNAEKNTYNERPDAKAAEGELWGADLAEDLDLGGGDANLFMGLTEGGGEEGGVGLRVVRQ